MTAKIIVADPPMPGKHVDSSSDRGNIAHLEPSIPVANATKPNLVLRQCHNRVIAQKTYILPFGILNTLH